MFAKYLVLIGFLSCVGCSDEAAREGTEPKAGGAEAVASEKGVALRESFDGRIVPLNATDLRAPQNTFRIGTWSSDSSWIKLLDVAPDGKEIKQGEVVGRFEFRGKEALPRVKEQIQSAEAERDRAMLDVDGTRRQMLTANEQLALDAERARLDTLKEGVISARDLERFMIDHERASFEHEAQQKQIGAYERSVRAEGAFQERNVAQAQKDMERYKTYEERFIVRAPHDGVVRHGYMPWGRRKIQKGDGMPAGTNFASVARDATLGVEIFIPEHRYALTRSQRRFIVKSPSSSASFVVEVKRIDPFPQEVGFVKQDNNLPNAREKIYVLHAEFVEADYEELSAGLDVKVSLP